MYPHYLPIIAMAANGSALKNVSTNQFFATQAVPLKTAVPRGAQGDPPGGGRQY